MPELSVIVPVYNAETYLRKCVSSILQQTYRDLEVILVNDGSIDSSGRIAQEIADEDARVKVINQVNQGVSSARNAGLRIAAGKYIGFVDADDLIEPTMYEILISELIDRQADLACCGYQTVFANGKADVHDLQGLDSVMDRNTFIMHLFDAPRTISQSACNKLFLRDKIVHFFDEDLIICEDSNFLIEYAVNIQKVVIIKKAFYHVFNNENSATRKENGKTAMGLATRKIIIERLACLNSKLSDVAEKDYLDSCLLHCNSMKDNKKSEYYKIAVDNLRDYVGAYKWKVINNKEIPFKLKLLIMCKALTG